MAKKKIDKMSFEELLEELEMTEEELEVIFNKEMTMPTVSPLYTIGDSSIHGQGVIATKKFNNGDFIGNFSVEYMYRTPLAAFVNHEVEPNARLIIQDPSADVALVSARPIEKGEEITLHYAVLIVALRRMSDMRREMQEGTYDA